MIKSCQMIKNYKIIQEAREIQEVLHQVKDLKRGLITNFYLESFKHDIWINQRKFYLVWIKDTALLIYLDNGFNRLFYISPNLLDLEKAIGSFIRENIVEKVVIDLVGPESILQKVSVIFNNAGFIRRSSLVRMSSAGQIKSTLGNPSVVCAKNSDANMIESLLHKYFDKFVEQLPMKEELIHWIENKQVLIYQNGDKIGGFLIYQNMVNTAYLRYWFVHHEFRNQKIGSKLINKFFDENIEVKRFLFWVVESNENAIKRYLHYGFKPEKLKNIVLTINID